MARMMFVVSTLVITISNSMPSEAGEFLSLSSVVRGAMESSIVQDVSNDGTTVIGSAISGGISRPFQWRLNGNLTPIVRPSLESADGFVAAVSGDGSQVVGMDGNRPFSWTPLGGLEYLDFLPGRIRDMTPDGRVIVGQVGVGSGTGDAFRWEQGQGVEVISDNGRIVAVDGVSDNGLVVVGAKNHLNTEFLSGVPEAFRWTQSAGFEDLGFLALNAAPQSRGFAASRDGLVIVGGSSVDFGGNTAIRWTPQTAMVDLGDLGNKTVGERGSFATDVTPNGRIVVGQSVVRAVGPGVLTHSDPFIWDAVNKMRNLSDFIGPNADGWQLGEATGISADGRIISGVGFNPNGLQEGWVIRLDPSEIPEPPSFVLALLAGIIVIAATHRNLST